MTTLLSNSMVLLGVEPIHVIAPTVESATALGAAAPFPWMPLIAVMVGIAALVVLGVCVIGGLSAYKRIRALHPEEQAFRAVCRTLRIPQASWVEIRSLAKRIDAAPVALLISQTAFDRATGLGSGGPRLDSPPALVSLRARLFGDDHAS